MAGANFKIVRSSVPATTGTQDITLSGFGTPKAVIVRVVSATSDDTLSQDAILSEGFYDGTTQVVTGTSSQDALAVTNTASNIYNNAIVSVNSTSTTDVLKATASFITDGVRLNWTTVTGSAHKIVVTLINGNGVNCYVGQTVSATGSVTGITKPDIIYFNTRAFASSNGRQNSAYVCTGFSINDNKTTPKNYGTYWKDDDFKTTSYVRSKSDNSAQPQSVVLLSVTSFNSDGFTLYNPTIFTTYLTNYLAIDLGSGQAQLIDTFVSSTGPLELGSTPDVPTYVELHIGKSYGESLNHNFTFGAYDGTTGYSLSNLSASGMADSYAKSFSSTNFVSYAHDGTERLAASYTGFTSTGIELNVTNGTASSIPLYGFLVTPEITTKVTLNSGSYAVTGSSIAFSKTNVLKQSSGAFAISGTDVLFTAGKTSTAESGTYSINGVDVVFKRDRVFPLDSGSYSLSGTNSGLLHNKYIATNTTSYAVYGTDQALNKGFSLLAGTGSYSLAGTDIVIRLANKVVLNSGSVLLQPTDIQLLTDRRTTELASGTNAYIGTQVSLIYNRVIQPTSTLYTQTPTDVNLFANRSLQPLNGVYDLVGTSVAFQGNTSIQLGIGAYSTNGTPLSLIVNRKITELASGVYSSIGTNVPLNVSRLLVPSTASYTQSGEDITLSRDFILTQVSGVYTVAGTDTQLSFTKTMVANNGTYTLSGTDVSMVYSGAPLVTAFGDRLIIVSLEDRVITIS